MPTTAELASIGDYRLGAVIACLKLARRLKGVPPAVPHVAYSGHTAAPASRKNLNAALRLDPGTGFRDIYRAIRPHHRFPELIGALAVPVPITEAEGCRATVLAHFAEGIIGYWLGTINDDAVLRVIGLSRLTAYASLSPVNMVRLSKSVDGIVTDVISQRNA